MPQAGAPHGAASSAPPEAPVHAATPCAVLADPAGLFAEWFQAEEAEWQRVHQLAEACPVHFVCPISLEIMHDPVILVRRPGLAGQACLACGLCTRQRCAPARFRSALWLQVETGQCYERGNIRKWFFMGGDTCPLTGVRLRSTEVSFAVTGKRNASDCCSTFCCPARLICAWFSQEKSTGLCAAMTGSCNSSQLVADTALQTRIAVWTDNRSLDRGLAPAAPAASEGAAADSVLSSADSRPSSAAKAVDAGTGSCHAGHAAALPPPVKERGADERGKQTEPGGGDADKDVSAKEQSGSGSRSSCARSPRRGKLSERESRAGAGGRLMRVFSNAAYAWREAALLGAPPLRAARTPTAAPVHAAARVTPYPNPVFLDPALRWRSATSARRDASGRARVPRPHSSGLGGHSARWARSPRALAAAGAPAPQKPPCAAIELCAQQALLATAADASALGAAARMT